MVQEEGSIESGPGGGVHWEWSRRRGSLGVVQEEGFIGSGPGGGVH